MFQARIQAEEAEKERIRREAAYRAEAAKETARLWAQQEAARKVQIWRNNSHCSDLLACLLAIVDNLALVNMHKN
jgi:hypothetical protein